MESMSKVLYLYGHSYKNISKSHIIQRIIQEQSRSDIEIHLVLIHDGVLGANVKGRVSEFIKKLLDLPIQVYILKPDLIARGGDPETIHENIKLVDFDDLVDLIVDIPITASWM